MYRFRHGDSPLEGYTIQRGVGRGAFGEVYYAVSEGGREVALKALIRDEEIELRGVRHCINLKHPNLVSIFDIRTGVDGTPFVIMEYVNGPSLRDLIREHPRGLGEKVSAFFLREIAKGLNYLHERDIVHRDLKPENIFYEDGYVKIGDYGLSKLMSASRQSGNTISVGTVHYMAPEIGTGNYRKGIDIYALGVILFEMLTGDVPFQGDSFGEIILKHMTLPPDLGRIPGAFRSAVEGALRKDPRERISSADELVLAVGADAAIRRSLESLSPESLARAGGSLPIESREAGPAERAAAAAETVRLEAPASSPPEPRAPLPAPPADSAPPGSFARAFWVFVGCGLLAGGASSLLAPAVISFRGEDVLFPIAYGLAMLGYGGFAFYRAFLARGGSLWKRSLKPFALTSIGVVTAISAAGFVHHLAAGDSRRYSFALPWAVALAYAAVSLGFFVHLNLSYGRWKHLAAEATPGAPRRERAPPTALRVWDLVLSAVAIGMALAIAAMALLEFELERGGFAALSSAVALAALGGFFFRQANRRRRGVLWADTFRPLVAFGLAAVLGVCALPIAFGLGLRGEEKMTLIVAAGIAVAFGAGLLILRATRRAPEEPGAG